MYNKNDHLSYSQKDKITMMDQGFGKVEGQGVCVAVKRQHQGLSLQGRNRVYVSTDDS